MARLSDKQLKALLEDLGRKFWEAEGDPEERKRLTAEIYHVAMAIREKERS